MGRHLELNTFDAGKHLHRARERGAGQINQVGVDTRGAGVSHEGREFLAIAAAQFDNACAAPEDASDGRGVTFEQAKLRPCDLYQGKWQMASKRLEPRAS